MGLLSYASQGVRSCNEPVMTGYWCGLHRVRETITPEKPVKLRVFTFRDLEIATDGFSNEAFLGHASHGSVYKGTLKDGRLVTVKRQNNSDDEIAFDNELELLSTIHSERFVNLLGFSKDSESHEKLLVVDFMPNGTLYEILHYCPEPLSWAMRVHLALQIAKSISALHSASPPVIHRDIKSANILLDGRWNAKLGHFGLAHRGHIEDVLRHQASRARTMGYVDPSYETPVRLSTKSDVFSFGVLLLEVISGREAVDTRYKPPHITDWALPLIKQGKTHAVFDPKLPVSPQNVKPLKTLIEVAARCLRRAAQRRPTMASIVSVLEDISARVPLPPWIGLARVMKRGHMQRPDLPRSLEFQNNPNPWSSNKYSGRRGALRSDTTGINGRNRPSYEGQNAYDQHFFARDQHGREFYRDLSNITEESKEYSSPSSREFNQSQQYPESRDPSFRKVRRDSRESSRDYVRDQSRSRTVSCGPSRENSREQSKEWVRDHSKAEHPERSTDLPRELTREVIEASLNHIRKWRNSAFDHSKADSKSYAKFPRSPEMEVPKFSTLTVAAAAAHGLPSTQTHRRNKSDGSITFRTEEMLPKDGESPGNLKRRSSSGSRRFLLRAMELIKDKEQKAGTTQIIWIH